MTRQVVVRRGLAVGLALGAALALAPALAADAVPRPEFVPAVGEGAGSPALAQFGTCLQGAGGRGDLLILMDESASLRGYTNFTASDPDAVRVTAARLMLNQLAQTAETNNWSGLNVSVAGFSSDYEERLGWTELPAGLGAALTAMDAQAKRDNGQETDYWHALTSATEVLTARRSGEADVCQAVFWFSDGAFSLEPNVKRANDRKVFEWAPELKDTTKEQVKQAEEAATGGSDFRSGALCKPAGVVDGLRANGIYLFAVGLASKDAPATAFELMTAMAEGPTARCGDQEPLGQFYPASSLEELLIEFNRFGDPSQVPVDTDQAEICQEADPEACVAKGAGYSHSFTVDDSITKLTGLATAPAGGLKLYVVPPEASPIDVTGTGGTLTPGGVAVDWEALPQDAVSATTLTFAQGGGTDWAGEWRVLFVDPTGSTANQKSNYSFRIEADIKPIWELVTEPELVQPGATIEGRITWEHNDGQPIRELAGELSLEAHLAGQDYELESAVPGQDVLDPDTVWSLTIPEDARPGEASLVLTTWYVAAGTAGSDGTPIQGTTASYPLTIYPLPGYPQKVAKEVALGKLEEGATSGSGQLEFTGPGCLWLDEAATTAEPADATGVKWSSTANSAETCVSAGEGEIGHIQIDLTMEQGGNGQAAGALTVMAAPEGAGEPQAYQATASATASKKIDAVTLWLVLLVAVVLGLGFPFLVLYVLKFLGTKIRQPQNVMAKRFQVQVMPGSGLELAGGGLLDPNSISPTADVIQGPAAGARSVMADGFELKVVYGANPYGLGHVKVVAPGLLGASSSDGWPKGKDHHAALPLAIGGNWVVLVDPNAGAAPADGTYGAGGPVASATLLVLASIVDPAQGAEATLADAQAKAPDVIDRLARSAREEGVTKAKKPKKGKGAATPPAPEQPADPWASSGPGADGFGQADPWGSPAGGQPGGSAPDPWGGGGGYYGPPPGAGPGGPPGSPGPAGPSGNSDPWA
ncbi:MAG: VWA domain-containing protein [Bifidobacteriaceae bacterium]|jgi:hypothetical protein|nr:VWA domain-containing protein [Bifidobacteriaceae bacterium]